MPRFEFEAIGTLWQIDVFQDLSQLRLSEIEKKIHKRIDEFDITYSRFRNDSVVTKMSQQKGSYTLPNDSKKLFQVYKQLYDVTDGLFTPLIGQVLSDAGYDANYSLQPKKLTRPEKWEEVMTYSADASVVTLKKPALLDFGAAGKGYLIDLVGEVLLSEKMTSFCIDAGGDILFKTDSEPMRIGLENPENIQQVIGVVTVKNQSVCGSAGNRRKWGEFHHTINPKTLASPKHILAVWAVADEAILADGLTTALYFVPSSILKEKYDFEYAILNADFSIEKSPGFPAEFFYN
jgi:thiamine biosynthesis lipoprotein